MAGGLNAENVGKVIGDVAPMVGIPAAVSKKRAVRILRKWHSLSTR